MLQSSNDEARLRAAGVRVFSESEIGLYKADVLATRINLFWGLGWGIQRTDRGEAMWQWGR